MIRVYVVDSRELLRRGLRAALDETADLTLVGESAMAADAGPDIAAVRPDVVLIDFEGADPDAVDLCTALSTDEHVGAVIASFASTRPDRIGDAVLAGAAGQIGTDEPIEGILDHIRQLHSAPRPTLATDLVGDLFDRVRTGQPTHRDPLAPLTDREREIIALLAEGFDNRRIGAELHLSPKTVKNYVSAILKKLGMGSRTEAAVFAAREVAPSGTRSRTPADTSP